MKYTIVLFLFATTSLSVPVRNKATKAFSLFSVLSFPNDECTTTKPTEPQTSGLCLTESECTQTLGVAEGNCASGFGVCCYLSVSDDTDITRDITYITNPEYPDIYAFVGDAGIRAARTWTFRIGGEDICQIRLDFEDVVLLQPLMAITGNENGLCANAGQRGDAIKVKTSTTRMVGFNELCGTLTGQHVYIHGPDAVLTINTGSPVAGTVPAEFEGRKWNIKTTLIECESPSLADRGCLQWFTDIGGRIQSFNKLEINPITLSNLLYTICIRREDGFCGFAISETTPTRSMGNDPQPDSFNLQKTDVTDGDGVLGVKSFTDSLCNNEYVGISSTIHKSSRYCGNEFAPGDGNVESGVVFSDVLPFRISVVSSMEVRELTTGFDLTYRQTPCN